MTSSIRGLTFHSVNQQAEEHASGGVVIAVYSQHVNLPSILTTPPLEAVAVCVFSNTALTVCTLYLPPITDLNPVDLDILNAQLPCHYVIVGHFNAHNPL